MHSALSDAAQAGILHNGTSSTSELNHTVVARVVRTPHVSCWKFSDRRALRRILVACWRLHHCRCPLCAGQSEHIATEAPSLVGQISDQRPTNRCRCSGYLAPWTVIAETALSISLASPGVSSTEAAPIFSARR